MKRINICLIACLTLFILSCKKSEDGGTANFNFAVRSISAGGMIEWDSCYVNISGVSFQGDKKSGELFSVSADDIVHLDLLSNDKVFASMHVDGAKYTGVSINLRLYKDNPLNDATIFLSGVYKLGSEEIPVEVFLYESTINALVNNLNTTESDQKTGTFTINLEKLFEHVEKKELDSASRISEMIIIAQDVNSTIYSKLRQSLNAATNFSF